MNIVTLYIRMDTALCARALSLARGLASLAALPGRHHRISVPSNYNLVGPRSRSTLLLYCPPLQEHRPIVRNAREICLKLPIFLVAHLLPCEIPHYRINWHISPPLISTSVKNVGIL
jgi:hypothetical protein